MGIDQTLPLCAQQRTGGRIVLRHLLPFFMGQTVEDIRRLKLRSLHLEFAHTAARLDQYLLPDSRIELQKTGLQQTGIEEADVKQTPAAGTATFATGNIVPIAFDAPAEPAIHLFQQQAVRIKKVVKSVHMQSTRLFARS